MARHRSTGWGHGGRLPGPRSWLFFNFDVDSSLLKIEHRDMLRKWVVPELKLLHGISIIGLASRTGFRTHNVRLSQKRADKTLEFLRSEVRNNFRALNVIGLGELAAAKVDRDGTEDPRFRSVVVVAGNGPVPPPPPAKVDLDNVISPKAVSGRDVGDDIQWGIDRSNDILSILSELPWEHVAEFAENAGLGLNIIAAVAQMPLLYWSLRHQNQANGKLEGFWDAMQDMANDYSNTSLQSIPLERWPPLRKPHPRAFTMPDNSVNQKEWMEGRVIGCQVAYDVIKDLEIRPKVFNGEHRPTSGRQVLARMISQYGSGLKEEIQRAYEKKLGKSWPITG